MKKYIAPEIEIEDIFSEDIITNSPGLLGIFMVKAPEMANATVESDEEYGAVVNGDVSGLQ